MRAAAISIVLVIAGPAAAQPTHDPYDATREAELGALQMLSRQREVALQNQLNALEVRLSADQAVRQIEAMRARPTLPMLPPPQAGVAAAPAGYASIPDDRLRASREKVRDASRDNR